ncbi:hypothetical protein FDP41_012353 [Naegleria fowleri]|uniref:Uncharacterized protein n=1 Tax=Naegleria fowleri TaxID=5763 RepID=A0A6A5C1Z4_NAEFO|nr:uncharacterized protein FDP41_012353 [Naegleria fowleri]KAF0981696.1 hypothetical protein FDP41_012353 [Naegleria fowleri]CAG4712067.1 unnamed protein product [Naegleria fowleri]
MQDSFSSLLKKLLPSSSHGSTTTQRPSLTTGPFTKLQLLRTANRIIWWSVPLAFAYSLMSTAPSSPEQQPMRIQEKAAREDISKAQEQWKNVREALTPFWLSASLRNKLAFDQVTEVDFLKELEWKIVDGNVIFKEK